MIGTGSILLAILAVAALWAVLIFNALTRGRNLTHAAWSDMDVQLQRRHDLIPRLVEAVKGYAGYERATLEAVTALRDQSRRSQALADKAAIEDELEAATHKLLALAENYPDLKANQNFLSLQDELAETENLLQYARRFYNGAVRDYNTRLQSLPDLFVARAFAFLEREFFLADQDARTAVEVDLA
jgi:LemA protein